VGNLSGGNQQKTVIAKWLFRRSEVLIFDEPTRGIDVGARFEIYQLLWRLAAAGKGILIVSSDFPSCGICHRILVFSNGRSPETLPRDQFQPGADPGMRLPRVRSGEAPSRLLWRNGPRVEGGRMRAKRIFYLLLREAGIGLALAPRPRFAASGPALRVGDERHQHPHPDQHQHRDRGGHDLRDPARRHRSLGGVGAGGLATIVAA